MHTLDYPTLSRLAAGRPCADVPCPVCSPLRSTPANRRKPVLTIWSSPGFATYCCAHFGARGWARDDAAPRLDHDALARLREAARRKAREDDAAAIRAARGLYWRSDPITPGTPAWRYLRDMRGYAGPIPATMRCLPATRQFPPALLVAAGVPNEPEPGVLELPIYQVRAVQLVRLTPDGRKVDDGPAKITRGRLRGSPMVIAPMNDGLGLWITEGPENALSLAASYEVGIWASGGKSFLPALAPVVPAWVDCVRVVADDDETGEGERCARELVTALGERGIYGELTFGERRAAA